MRIRKTKITLKFFKILRYIYNSHYDNLNFKRLRDEKCEISPTYTLTIQLKRVILKYSIKLFTENIANNKLHLKHNLLH